MIEIPSNILALLKSRQQIGENRPTGKIAFIGASAAIQEWTPSRWIRSGGPDEGWQGGSFVTKADGTVLVTYGNSITNKIYLASAPNEDAIFREDNRSAATEVADFTPANPLDGGTAIPSRLLRLGDGSILLFILDNGLWVEAGSNLDPSIEVYLNADGMGESWSKIGTVPSPTSAVSISRFWSSTGQVGQPIILDSGKIILPWMAMCGTDGDASWGIKGSFVSVSNDNGATWVSTLLDNSMWHIPIGSTTRGVFKFRDVIAIQFQGRNIFNVGVAHFSMDEGATWSYVAKNAWSIWESTFWGADGYNYWLRQPDYLVPFLQLWRRPDTDEWGDGKVWDDLTKWEMLRDTIPFCSGQEVIWTTGEGRIAVVGTDSPNDPSNVFIWGGIKEEADLCPKSINISRSKGSASQANIVMPNTNGVYAPDPAGAWNHVMWPNKSVQIQLGYGQYLPQVFDGLIDEVDMETPPQMISVTARDHSKKVLDQMCQWTWDGVTYYDGAWAAQDPEGIFVALATMAGFAEADTVYDVTGIVIPEFKFNQQTYADLIQKLAEMSGCEWYCDEQGKIYFKLVTYPEAVPAYSFVAGVDIFSLGYKISDAEIYRDVVVTAQGPEDENGNSETISVRVEWSAADYYGLPPHKTLYVTASDIVQDEAGCLEIANRMLLAMTTKPRQVQFVAVGIPNLQIGDCIQVTEASSTISEIYRVYDFEHQFDAEGSPVFVTAIKCYWYAHG